MPSLNLCLWPQKAPWIWGAVCALLNLGQHTLKRSWHHLVPCQPQVGTLHPGLGWGQARILVQKQAAKSRIGPLQKRALESLGPVVPKHQILDYCLRTTQGAFPGSSPGDSGLGGLEWSLGICGRIPPAGDSNAHIGQLGTVVQSRPQVYP